ncbi:metallopeptidase TldD-related protein [Halorussus gelatinilyticus]|uniref:Metallopeptidase TldD-related protein n=1 Tax=Halorussus gelatinilyticus TaxID=2937524 RepID=A0A8U0IMR2_9EURY|nr:metallopeptidase TldD-related protein [Halorussus gelatinilyticus]UPW01891.1 metallopeptidase TldD-related protein [Halorussus gelatinilyticus]
MGELEAVIDVTESVLDRLESNDDVAYAEVGGVARRATDAVVTAEEVRSASDVAETGVWWRLFADGAADYRYTTSFDANHLDTLVEKSVRSGRLLGQETPAKYDRGTVHRATHPGWARRPVESGHSTDEESLDAIDAAEKAETVGTALERAVADLDAERTRATYRDETVESVLLTTTGSAVNTTVERASVEPTVVPETGTKRGGHVGATTGAAFLDSLSERLANVVGRAADAESASALPSRTPEPGRRTVAVGPRAAAELFHHLAHYLEIDAVYFGSSPYRIGDRIGPDALSMADEVPAGSWAARAYDAEGRPTQSASLVAGGVVRNHVYDSAAAIREEAFPAGNLVPSLGFDRPPRVHARHLRVESGTATASERRSGATASVERVGSPHVVNEATRTKRTSGMPPSLLYARDIGETTPAEFDAEASNQRLRFPVVEGYALDGGERVARLSDAALEVELADFETLDAFGARTETVTGTCTKHKSTLPYAVTAPGVRLSARVLRE